MRLFGVVGVCKDCSEVREEDRSECGEGCRGDGVRSSCGGGASSSDAYRSSIPSSSPTGAGSGVGVDLSTALPLLIRFGWPFLAVNFRSTERKPKGSSLRCSLGAFSTSPDLYFGSGSWSTGREEGNGEVGIGEDGGNGEEAFNPAGCFVIDVERGC